ncbi:MAG: enoyl-CoA hydratase/isomerase family protein [Rectinemataceae bacterium]
MEKQRILVEVTGGIATLTINRPEALNALDAATLEELLVALSGIAADRSLRAAILTGAGKAFVAGADITAMSGMSPAGARAFGQRGQAVFSALEKLPIPIIAAVNGYALGGGLELALACDFIYASQAAKFGLPETTLGLIPGFGGSKRLARLIGPNRARELILTGRAIDAATALAWGLVNALYDPEELLPKAREAAERMAAAGPRAVASAREALAFGLEAGLDEALAHEAALFGLLFTSGDAREGMAAFVEKRKPVFTGD